MESRQTFRNSVFAGTVIRLLSYFLQDVPRYDRQWTRGKDVKDFSGTKDLLHHSGQPVAVKADPFIENRRGTSSGIHFEDVIPQNTNLFSYRVKQ